MLPVMQVGRVRPGAPPEHDVLHPVGGGLGQARPTNNIGIHGPGCGTVGHLSIKLVGRRIDSPPKGQAERNLERCAPRRAANRRGQRVGKRVQL
ncbi:MAG: hypothetical protein FJ404_08155 [Verrucomicrobia bacterium]|nr:hypothetical protein [Verrucomicrobiota bacterium]